MLRMVLLAGALTMVMAWAEGADAALVTYLGAGRSATADYSFVNGTTLQIVLTDQTTGPTGGDPSNFILTSVGFKLPTGVDLLVAGSTVAIGSGSQSVGFDAGSFGAGADVSGEFGIANDSNPGNGGSFDFVSANTAHVTRLSGSNLDGPPNGNLNGPQGGLMNLAATTRSPGGLGVIDHSVVITLNLSQSLDSTARAAFLSSVLTNSVLEYGSDAAFLSPTVSTVPEPGTLRLALSALVIFGVVGLLRRSRRITATA